MGTATLAVALFFTTSSESAADSAISGMPIVHSYSFEDIGNIPRASHLTFDRFGRVSVIHDSTFFVLNDNMWLSVAESEGPDRIPMGNIIQAPDGNAYYGARSSWGRVAVGADGTLHPVPLAPPGQESWLSTAIFFDLIAADEGVYFGSWNGFAYWDFSRKKAYSFPLNRVSKLFRVGRRTYLSCAGYPLSYLDTKRPSIELAPGTELDHVAVEYSTPLDETRSLVVLADGRLLAFDGHTLSPWAGSRALPPGNISALQHLVDGNIALGITGSGLYILSADGKLLLGLTAPTYLNIVALANREPGVLWLETEDVLQKVLYASPVTSFGQEQGLPLSWPSVASWQSTLLVVSGGKLYQLQATGSGKVAHFSAFHNQPSTYIQTVAVCGSHLLVGGESGAYSLNNDGTYQRIPAAEELMHLVAIDDAHCFTIGRKQVGLLEYRNGEWIDCVPRIPGISSPSIVHRVRRSVWIEAGGDGVARLHQAGGELKLDVIRNETWTKCRWVNVGVVDDVAVLTGLDEEPRRFFDEDTESWCRQDELQNTLEHAPLWIARVLKDQNNRIWATYNQGLMCLTPDGNRLHFDSFNFDLINDRYPLVTVLPGNDVWVTAEHSLYHIDSTRSLRPAAAPKPFLISVRNSQEELLAKPLFSGAQLKIPFTDNTLSFRFYSGTDMWRKPPSYEYRIGEKDTWKELDGPVLNFHGLREGDYNVQVRIASVQTNDPFALELVISPPWYRSRQAYLFLCALIGIVVAGTIRYIDYLNRRRARNLELLVHKRTQQLEAATIQLSEEARKAAILTERDRVANEIHDSVQQGLTGAILQLDTTMKLGIVMPEVRERLGMVRNTVSYVRQEVQRTIWDVESPLLEGAALPEALHNFSKFIDTEGASVGVEVFGLPMTLRPSVSHNLLRVAQEATANAIRHGKATRIAIRLHYNKTHVILEVEDDGTGFVADGILQKAGHLGLRGMGTRVKKLGGKFSITSTLQAGTSIRAVIPHSDPKPHGESQS